MSWAVTVGVAWQRLAVPASGSVAVAMASAPCSEGVKKGRSVSGCIGMGPVQMPGSHIPPLWFTL
ncbi:hypothetical protein GCM10027202_18530 [Microvirgula curvata]